MKSPLAVTELKHFQIKGNGSSDDQQLCSVYKNGRQQVQIEILINAWAGPSGPVVPLTEEQLRLIKFIDYDSGKDLDTQLIRSYTKNNYEYWDGISLLQPRAVNQDMSTITLWISLPVSTNSPSLRIAAKITLDGAEFKTNNHDATPGGELSEGSFNSSIKIIPVTPYAFKAAAFKVYNYGAIRYGYGSGYTGDNVSLERWVISFIDPHYRIRGSDISTSTPTNWFSQYIHSIGSDRCHYALPVLPLNSLVWLGYQQTGTSTNDIYVYPYTDPSAAYAIIERGSFSTHRYVSKGVTYYDQNGCGHFIYVNPHEKGDTIRITDYPARSGDAID